MATATTKPMKGEVNPRCSSNRVSGTCPGPPPSGTTFVSACSEPKEVAHPFGEVPRLVTGPAGRLADLAPVLVDEGAGDQNSPTGAAAENMRQVPTAAAVLEATLRPRCMSASVPLLNRSSTVSAIRPAPPTSRSRLRISSPGAASATMSYTEAGHPCSSAVRIISARTTMSSATAANSSPTWRADAGAPDQVPASSSRPSMTAARPSSSEATSAMRRATASAASGAMYTTAMDTRRYRARRIPGSPTSGGGALRLPRCRLG